MADQRSAGWGADVLTGKDGLIDERGTGVLGYPALDAGQDGSVVLGDVDSDDVGLRRVDPGGVVHLYPVAFRVIEIDPDCHAMRDDHVDLGALGHQPAVEAANVAEAGAAERHLLDDLGITPDVASGGEQ